MPATIGIMKPATAILAGTAAGFVLSNGIASAHGMYRAAAPDGPFASPPPSLERLYAPATNALLGLVTIGASTALMMRGHRAASTGLSMPLGMGMMGGAMASMLLAMGGGAHGASDDMPGMTDHDAGLTDTDQQPGSADPNTGTGHDTMHEAATQNPAGGSGATLDLPLVLQTLGTAELSALPAATDPFVSPDIASLAASFPSLASTASDPSAFFNSASTLTPWSMSRSSLAPINMPTYDDQPLTHDRHESR